MVVVTFLAWLGTFSAFAAPLADIQSSPAEACHIRVGSGDKFIYCSGTLIAPQVVLTAAHCFYNVPSEVMKGVFVGCGLTSQGPKGDDFAFNETFTAVVGYVASTQLQAGSDVSFLLLDRPSQHSGLPLPGEFKIFSADFFEPSPLGDDLKLKSSVECRFSGYGVDPTTKRPRFRTIDQSPENGVHAYLDPDERKAILLALNGWAGPVERMRQGDSGGGLYCRKDTKSPWLVIAVLSGGDKGKASVWASTASWGFRRLWDQFRSKLK